MRDTDAAKDLLYRRAKCLSEFDNANKALDKARAKNKDISAVSIAVFKIIIYLNSSVLYTLSICKQLLYYYKLYFKINFFVSQAESAQQKANEKFEAISDISKQGKFDG